MQTTVTTKAVTPSSLMATPHLEEFKAFPKIPRWNRDVIITEKLDGTNAQVIVTENGDVLAASRTRFIKVGDDNYGFAAWVEANKEQLKTLGVGRHYGEWYGSGIQRTYGLAEKRFALFNPKRYARFGHPTEDGQISVPPCCEVIMPLFEGRLTEEIYGGIVREMTECGSYHVPGFMKPEGFIIYHTAANQMFKVILENDDLPKGMLH